MRIGITDTFKPSLAFYTEWLAKIDRSLEFVVLSYVQQNADRMESLDGLVLTGGGDVDPRYYGAEDPLGKAKDVNASRDEFEFNVIERALDLNIPILGICRGMQVMNVYLGGTLIPDLPSAGYENHAKNKEYKPDHRVVVQQDTRLHSLTRERELMVNSSHHQAVGKLGNGLQATATSPDGVVEGAEWSEESRTPFLLLVQWHPERMESAVHTAASRALASGFLEYLNHRTTIKIPTKASNLLEH